MDYTNELRDVLAETIENDPSQRTTETNGVLNFLCPIHDDSNPSAWLGNHAWGCRSCGFKKNLVDLAVTLGVKLPSNDYSLDQYAHDKGFDPDRLVKYGVTTTEKNGAKILEIPYYDEQHKYLRSRMRSRNGSRWWSGDTGPIYLYGLWMLPSVEGPVVLVEGESDCHAAWQHSVLAIGVPGADTWKHEWADHLKGRDIYVWQEPDQGGAAFLRKVARDFPSAKVLKGGEVKDLADLFLVAGDKFTERLSEMMSMAVPIGTPEPPVVYDAAVGETLDRMLEWSESPIEVVKTMWPTWNSICRGAGGGQGVAKGWHCVLAARTGAGKSLLGANLASEGVKQGERVGFISLEMVQEEVLTRSLAIHSGVEVKLLEKGPQFNRSAFMEARTHFENDFARTGGTLFVNREPIYKLEDVMDSMRFLHEVRGCEMFIVDYLQLIRILGITGVQAVEEVSSSIRLYTKQQRLVTFGLSQFNRETSKSKERPTKEGLMGGSPLENDADQVVLIDHSRVVKENGRLLMFALVDKNRHGPLLDIPISLETSNLRMIERVGDEEEHLEVEE